MSTLLLRLCLVDLLVLRITQLGLPRTKIKASWDSGVGTAHSLVKVRTLQWTRAYLSLGGGVAQTWVWPAPLESRDHRCEGRHLANCVLCL